MLSTAITQNNLCKNIKKNKLYLQEAVDGRNRDQQDDEEEDIQSNGK